MNESEFNSVEAELEALRALQADASQLERIALDGFNVFGAVGFVTQETMHSHFMAFLLDAQQSWDDLFLVRFLDEALDNLNLSSLPVSLMTPPLPDLSLVDTSKTCVVQGWQDIDILLTNETCNLAVIIENNIWSAERSHRLQRHYETVKNSYPGWDVFGIYLTANGDAPPHEAYLPLSYSTICEVIDSVLGDQGPFMHPAIRMSMEHYTEMLRRNIVGDSKIARLCQQIYDKHHRALNLIYEHRPSHLEAIHKVLVQLIKDAPDLKYYNTVLTRRPNGEWISFRVQRWKVPELKGLAGGAYEDCILLFVFANLPDSLHLSLQLGPGDEETRRKLFHMAHRNRTTFNNVAESLEGETKLFCRTVLTPDFYKEAVFYEEVAARDRKDEIHRQWTEFLQYDLPRIDANLKKEVGFHG